MGRGRRDREEVPLGTSRSGQDDLPWRGVGRAASAVRLARLALAAKGAGWMGWDQDTRASEPEREGRKGDDTVAWLLPEEWPPPPLLCISSFFGRGCGSFLGEGERRAGEASTLPSSRLCPGFFLSVGFWGVVSRGLKRAALWF